MELGLLEKFVLSAMTLTGLFDRQTADYTGAWTEVKR
jgi:hypothetical protein